MFRFFMLDDYEGLPNEDVNNRIVIGYGRRVVFRIIRVVVCMYSKAAVPAAALA